MVSEWLHSAIRASLEDDSLSFTDSVTGPSRKPFQKIVNGTRYSKQFIVTYHLVILGAILLLTIIHWVGKAIQWRKRRATRLWTLRMNNAAYDADADTSLDNTGILKSNGTPDMSVVPAGNSTTHRPSIIARLSRPMKELNLETPPLLQSTAPELQPRPTLPCMARGFLMYQPRPLSYFNKTLPSNGESTAVLAFIFLNIFYTFHNINFTIMEIAVWADRSSLVFIHNLPLLYILAAKNQPLKLMTGRSYETLNIFHRRLGEILCLEALIHLVGMTGVWYTLLRPEWTFTRFLFAKVIMLGLGAFISYEALYLTSLASFRAYWYELFLAFHVTLQTLGLVFLFFHHHNARPYVGTALVIFVVDRFIYRLFAKNATIEATAVVMEDAETVKLSMHIIKQPRNSWSLFSQQSAIYGWKAADHVYITIPSLSLVYAIQSHPFTIASPAPASDEDETRLDLIIRARDGFTFDLLREVDYRERSGGSQKLTIRLDGPYGSSHARDILSASELSIVIAGGSGIAVAWPLIHHLLSITRSTDTEIIPTRVLRRQKIVLIWVIHKKEHKKWIGKELLKEVENMGVQVIVPKATERVGRPDLHSLISTAVEAYGMKNGNESKKIGVVASGPDGMGRLVRNTCAELATKGRNINVRLEKFGW